MNRTNSVILFISLALFLTLMGATALLKGGIYFGEYEADMLHFLQIILRMEAGQVPHLDFMTPIGILSFAPIVYFVQQGMGAGLAVIYAQIIFAAILLPAAWWVGVSRLQGWLAYLFGVLVIVQVTALVYGSEVLDISLSMHYNRWAWAVAFIAVGLAIIPPFDRNRPLIDGGIIGALMVALVLIKITYFIALAPAVIVALLMRNAHRSLLVAVIVGLLILAGFTVVYGFDFWLAYLRDLLHVVGNDARPYPGLPFTQVMFGAKHLGATAIAGAGLVLLRKSDQSWAGAVLLILIPGFIFITYQNFGNIPQWLPLLGIILLSLRQRVQQISINKGLTLAGYGAFLIALPFVMTMAVSPFYHLKAEAKDFSPLLAESVQHSDFLGENARMTNYSAMVLLDQENPSLKQLSDGKTPEEMTKLLNETLPNCRLVWGLAHWYNTVAQDLETTGLLKGKHMFVADILPSYWMFANLQPLPNGAPWDYAGLAGIENADYLMVPMCPASTASRKKMLDEISERSEISLTEVRRTSQYILLEMQHHEAL